MDTLRKLLNGAILLFAALLPLKFTHSPGAPAVPASYWGDIPSLIFCGWSMHVFSLAAALLLFFSLLIRPAAGKDGSKKIYLILWGAVCAASLCGIVNASCFEYVRQTLDVIFGCACFAASAVLALDREKNFTRPLLFAACAGALLSALAGWDQIFGGLGETRDFAEKTGLGGEMSGLLQRQLNSDRIFGTFPLCNTFAGYLAAVLPLAAAAAWLWAKDRFRTQRFARFLCPAAVLIFFAVPLWMTGSRGAILSRAAGVFAVLFPLLKSRGARLVLAGCAAAVFAFFVLLVIFRRGADSAVFRLDYWLAAFRMMFAHPFAGTGWGDFYHEYPALKLLLNDELPHSPHNLPLYFGSQCGMAGFLAALALIVWPLVIAFRRLAGAAPEERLFTAALTASLCVITLDSLLEVGIECPAFAGLMILLSAAVLHRGGPAEAIRPRYALPALLPVLAVIVLASVEIRREAAFADFYELAHPAFSRDGTGNPPSESDLRSAFEKAREAVPSNPFVYAEMARRSRDPHEARLLISQAIRLAPAETGFYRTRIRMGTSPDETESDRIRLQQLDPKGVLVRSRR